MRFPLLKSVHIYGERGRKARGGRRRGSTGRLQRWFSGPTSISERKDRNELTLFHLRSLFEIGLGSDSGLMTQRVGLKNPESTTNRTVIGFVAPL